MRSSSSELLLDQQEELRRRKLLELAQPRKPWGGVGVGVGMGMGSHPPQRTCRERICFYTTSLLAMTAVSGGSALLFLVPLYVDPAISTLSANFVSHPVRCVTTRREDLTGIFNCTWSSCREGCTSDMYTCTHVYVTYTSLPYYNDSGSGGGDDDDEDDDEEDEDDDDEDAEGGREDRGVFVMREAVLLDNIKGCGYPPEVDCHAFMRAYSVPGHSFPCYYSQENRTVVLTHYDRHAHVALILHYFAVPFIITVASSLMLCAIYCHCNCHSGRHHGRRRHPRRSAVEDTSECSVSTRVDRLTPHSNPRPL